MTETNVYELVSQYLNMQYPNVLYHFDLSGVNNTSQYSRNMYGKLNQRAWPDLFIASVDGGHLGEYSGKVEYYSGLFLEIKKEGTVIYNKDGTLRKNEHQIEQAMMLKALQSQGYKAEFAIGFNECKKIIDEYLKG